MDDTSAKRRPRIVLVGGGTGGHVYPALAVAGQLRRKRPEAQLLFIGGDRLEARVVPAARIRFRAISVHGLAGRGLSAWGRRLRGALELAIGLPLWQSMLLLRGFRAQVVVGTGGYVSGPVLLAARLLRIPSLALEGNRAPGLTSRMVAGMVNVMAVAWPDQVRFFQERVRREARVAVTGMPVRTEVAEMTRGEGAAALGLDPSRVTLLVLGGSLGSKPINEALVGALRLLDRGEGRLRELQVLHVIGEERTLSTSPEEIQGFAPGYRAVPYLADDYARALAAADLVVSRAGASTLGELIARGLPAVLIPWAEASTGEQERNAEPFAKAGGAAVVPDGELTAARLAQVLSELLWDTERRGRMSRATALLGRRDAAEQVADLVLELVEGD